MSSHYEGIDFDPVVIEVLQHIYDNACYKEDFPTFESFYTDNRIGWWPNGKLQYANLQSAGSPGGGQEPDPGWHMCGDNALPDDFGQAFSEVWYLDIGLNNNITKLPESIGMMFNKSFFQLQEDNYPDYELSETWPPYPETYLQCKEMWENLKHFPDPDYNFADHQAYKDTCYSVPKLNIHLDGNRLLGAPGTIPASISNWKELQMIWFGIGQDLVEYWEFPVKFNGWKLFHWANTANMQGHQFYDLHKSLCYVLPHFISPSMNGAMYMAGSVPSVLWDINWGGTGWNDWNAPYGKCESIWQYQPPYEGVPGDCDGDGVLTVSDIVMMIDCVLERKAGSVVDCPIGCDYNQDGIVNVQDVILSVNDIIGSFANDSYKYGVLNRHSLKSMRSGILIPIDSDMSRAIKTTRDNLPITNEQRAKLNILLRKSRDLGI